MKNRLHTVTLACVAAALAGQAFADGQSATEILTHDTLAQIAMGEHTLIEDFPLADAGRFTFDVERFTVLAPGARIVEQNGDVVRDIPDTNLVLLRGTIVGEDADSSVFLSVGQWGVNGVVTRGDEFFSISSGPYNPLPGPAPEVIVTSSWNLDYINDNFCQYDPADPNLNPVIDPADPSDRPLFDTNTARGAGGCNLAAVAVDTDYEFTNNRFGGNSSASSDYAQTLFGAASTIYERDVNVSLAIAHLRTFTTNTDPYSGNLDNFLNQVRDEWRTNMAGISRVIVHGMSGRSLGGGVAWLNTLCNTNYGYGVSAVNGFFPNPPEDHNNSNWDIIVVPHEMGHNFGSGHTHDGYNPPIDGCGSGNCTGAFGGTIMSYCHLCSGGIRNIVLSFHDRVQNVIEARVNTAGCITSTGDEFVAIDDSATTITGIAVTIDALVNDATQSCGTPEFLSVQSPTSNGGTVAIQSDSPFDTLRFTPAPGFNGTDTFTYTLIGGSTATVSVGVSPMRPGDNPSNPQPGVEVDYYLLNSPVVLPDFDGLTPLNSDVVPNIDFPETNGIFATGFLGNNVGAVFEGFVQVNVPGIYTFQTESDDGSRLWIGDTLVVDNDGLHGMETAEGQIGLLNGMHRTRVEFFESTGSAGLIVRLGLSSATPTVIPSNKWFYSTEIPCVADWNNDGELDFFDVQGFLGAFSAQDDAADLIDDDTFDFFDVQQFLGLFAAGCP